MSARNVEKNSKKVEIQRRIKRKTHVNKKRKINTINANKGSNIQNEVVKRSESSILPVRPSQGQATTLGKRKRLAMKHISDNNLIKASTLGVKRKKSNQELSKIQPKELKKNLSRNFSRINLIKQNHKAKLQVKIQMEY